MSRVLLAKTGLDGHWRGLSVVARALRDAGFEVILAGMSETGEITRQAVDEDVDLVGLNVGGHPDGVQRTVAALREEAPDIPIFVGGAIPPWAKSELEAIGLEVFPPGSSLPDIVDAARRLTSP